MNYKSNKYKYKTIGYFLFDSSFSNYFTFYKLIETIYSIIEFNDMQN
jgi:hypothetical protein